MANKLNVLDEITVTMTTNNTDAFYAASKPAQKAGSQDVCGFAVVVRYESGLSCHVWVAYSNGRWTNCVDCGCIDMQMKHDFVNYVKSRAEQSDLDLGYDAE